MKGDPEIAGAIASMQEIKYQLERPTNVFTCCKFYC
jgi:hypothetical protein